ncbi:MAG TPA: site-2 protease family protein [Solirubrobacteraceae bacterium]|nr:site-2 protease family protein [Solirubrobacteraceae bacterium]
MTARRGSLQLVRLFGIRIGVDYSWFLILFLAIFWFQGSFKRTLDGSDTVAYVTAVAAAFLVFASIVFHELGHALAARREGIGVDGIDLFLFGGLMKMRSEPTTPGAEFRVAAAGPLGTVIVIAVAAGAAAIVGGITSLEEAATLAASAEVSVAMQLFSIVVSINIVLLVFNLVPAYPLDGGRIARALVWKVTGDRNRATRAAAGIGRGFAMLLMGFGIYMLLVGQAFDGLWFLVLGYMLGQSARGALVHSAFNERLEGITVADIMDAEPVAIPADTPALRAYEDFFLRYGYDWFAVVDADGHYLGRAHRGPVDEAAHGPNAERPVREITGADPEGRVPSDAPLEDLIGSEPLRRLGALTAVDPDGRLRGVVTVEQVTRALRTRLAPG